MINYTTYARAILSDSTTIVNLIISHCEVPKHQTGLITNDQLNKTLLNPQNQFIKQDIHDYSLYIKTKREYVQLSEEINQQLAAVEAAIQKVHQQYKNASQPHKPQFAEAASLLEKEYKRIKILADNLAVERKEIDNFEKKFDTLTKNQDKSWIAFREDYLAKTQSEIEKADCPLSDMEKADLLKQESLPEIIDRFNRLNLKLPRKFDINKVQFSDYFYLKAYLAVQASLSRRMRPSGPEDIEKLL